MIEGITDAVELVVVAACLAASLWRALSARNMAWVTLACFQACVLLGGVYWFGYLVVYGETPHYSYVPDMAWIAGYVFLLMLVVEADQRRGVAAPVPAAWIPVIACAALCVFYIVDSGSPLLNTVENGLLAAIGFFAVRGIVAEPTSSQTDGRLAHNKPFHWAVLAFVAVEQAVWLSSCFLEPGPITEINPYIVLSCVLILVYAAILACAWKSGDA
ncbi:MAG: hypothetical protein IJ111_02505 [Eggerthellaceae bacterium]|nr:hypothetical protein [Eggerthellaceae bacterium]